MNATTTAAPAPGRVKTRVWVRWMIRRDFPEVLAIENGSFEFPWSEEDFRRCLGQRNVIGMVAEHDDRIVGYMVYEIAAARIRVLNFAVAPDFRRRGAGAQMMGTLAGKLSVQRRNRLVLEVREKNLDGQIFFRACGLKAVGVFDDFYDNGEAAYQFVMRVGER